MSHLVTARSHGRSFMKALFLVAAAAAAAAAGCVLALLFLPLSFPFHNTFLSSTSRRVSMIFSSKAHRAALAAEGAERWLAAAAARRGARAAEALARQAARQRSDLNRVAKFAFHWLAVVRSRRLRRLFAPAPLPSSSSTSSTTLASSSSFAPSSSWSFAPPRRGAKLQQPAANAAAESLATMTTPRSPAAAAAANAFSAAGRHLASPIAAVSAPHGSRSPPL